MRIYIIRNSVNDKVYIGQTAQSLKERLRKHLYDSTYPHKKNNTKFYNAIKKHGKCNFKIELICICSNKEELNAKEIEYIQLFNSIRTGYNTAYGGNVIVHTEESRRKISEANLGKIMSEETKRKISVANKGRQSTLGFKHSEETKANFSRDRAGKIITNEQKIKISETLKKIRIGEGNPFYGRKHTEATRKKLSEKRIGRKVYSKIKESDLDSIRQMVISGFRYKQIAELFSVSKSRISQISSQYGWVRLNTPSNIEQCTHPSVSEVIDQDGHHYCGVCYKTLSTQY